MPKGAGLMLSRKQQWRIACGRTRHVTTHHDHAKRRGAGNNNRPASSSDKVGYRTTPAAPCAAMESGGQERQRRHNSTEAELPAPLPRSTTTVQAATDPWGGCVEGATNEMSSSRRSVCFDKKIRVILVPTRHELKGKGEEATGQDTDSREEDDHGIWWSLQECFEFRRAYRRQILKLGLTQCRTLLCPATVVFLCDEPEEEAGENDNNNAAAGGGNNNSCHQMANEDIAAATAATASTVTAHLGCPVVEEVIG